MRRSHPAFVLGLSFLLAVLPSCHIAQESLMDIPSVSAIHGHAQRHVLAAPSNDQRTNANVLTFDSQGLFYQALDTSEATAEADELNCFTGEPLFRTVWYRFTYTGNEVQGLDFTTYGSSFTPDVTLFVSEPNAAPFISTCGDNRAQLLLIPGTTYEFMISAPTDPGPNTTDLVIRAELNPPRPEFSVQLDPVGTLDASDNSVTLTGTVTLNRSIPVDVSASIVQRTGRLTLFGSGPVTRVEVPADEQGPGPHARPFQLVIDQSNGKWTGGTITVFPTAGICLFVDCFHSNSPQQTVRLKGGTRR